MAQLSEVPPESAGPWLGSPAVSSDQRSSPDGAQPSEPRTDPMLPAITDDMLPPLNTPPVPTLDDRALAEMLAELEGEDIALLDSADPLGTSVAGDGRSVSGGTDGAEAGTSGGSPTALNAPPDPTGAGSNAGNAPSEQVVAPLNEVFAGSDGVVAPLEARVAGSGVVSAGSDVVVAGSDGAAVVDRPEPREAAPVRPSVGQPSRRTAEEERVGQPAGAPVRRSRQEQFTAPPAAPLVRSEYGDFRPPVSRAVEEPSLTGLTRRSRGKFGSVLFTVAFVVIFLLILTQALLSLLDAGASP